jgi:hypothetical protein
MIQLVASTVAAISAGAVSAFLFFWAVLCIFFGGPEGMVNNEALIAGLVSALVAVFSAWVAKVLFVAHKRVATDSASGLHRFALKYSPMIALVYLALLWKLGFFIMLYTGIAAALALAIRLRRR